MPTITPMKGTENFQITGLSNAQKQEMKTQAIKRNVSVSALLYAAYTEYVKRHPAS